MNWKSNNYSTPIIKYENTARDLYLDMLKSLATTPYPKWTIVVDTANGTQSEIIFNLLDALKIKYFKTGDCDIQSPVFIPRDTEVSSSFAEISRQVLLNKADFGIAFDVDGDRIVFIDGQGRYLPGDYSCTLIAQSEDTKSIVTPINTSSVIDSIGKTVYRTSVGSTHVAAKMKEVGAKFGFEPNGGGIFADIAFGRDGGVTLIKMLNLLKSSKKKLSDLYNQLPQYSLFREKIDCPFEKYDRVYEAVKEKYQDINDLDGIKVNLGPNEWILFRGSGNAPEFRVFVQSPDPKRAMRLGQEGLAFVKSQVYRVSPYTAASKLDSLGIFESIQALPGQCGQVIGEMSQVTIPANCHLVDNVVVSGMGGSALCARIISGLPLKIPLTISTEYHLPNFANEKTLVIISSYSGNTVETLSALADARSRGCQIFILSAGGKLAEIARQFDIPHYIFDPKHNPSGQPRMSLGYSTTALLILLSRCQLLQPIKDLPRLPEFLRTRQQDTSNIQSLVSNIRNRIPVIIASEHLKGAAHALKNQLNENAKTFAVVFDLPEANHHLMEGFAHPKTNPDNLVCVFIDSPHYHPETKKRYLITKEIVRKNYIPVFDLLVSGPNTVFEVMDVVQSGAYLAYYLSQEYGIDPGPIPWVDWMKDELKKLT